ncbi:MAG: YqaA family protein [Pseudidiomarina maritima]|nr:YqaA family protein [Pseudidiomarina maritima]
MVFLSLFISAFLSATLLPGSSEVLLMLLLNQTDSIGTLWAVATLGNVLGSCVNYSLGRYFLHWQSQRWFPVSKIRLAQGQAWFNRYGKWSLLLSWLPILGDPLTMFAGMLRLRFGWFLLLVSLGKGARYVLIIGLNYTWLQLV